ncbi:MAG: hypothetical protein IKH81_03635 [Clostridia bacterium]|nr:hypothetical protein [Clostridia bacterium]
MKKLLSVLSALVMLQFCCNAAFAAGKCIGRQAFDWRGSNQGLYFSQLDRLPLFEMRENPGRQA